MGIGDQLIATGLARGAAERGKRIAFGHGGRIMWDQHSALIFRNNPNIATPGQEGLRNLEWIDYRKGNRFYNSHDVERRRWVWNYDFRPTPGQVFLDRNEIAWGRQFGRNFVIIEPNTEVHKSSAPNKQWPFDRYDEIARRMIRAGRQVVQFNHGARNRHIIPGARIISTPTFRHALSVMIQSDLFIGCEGGLHHAAAALGRPAVVLFGGFIPPSVTGYEFHANLTGGAEACGRLTACEHCRQAMLAISDDEVWAAAQAQLSGEKASNGSG